MYLKVMSLVLRMPYSTIPAAPTGHPVDVQLTVDPAPQIPRRPSGSRLRRGLVYREGLRLDMHVPIAAGPHPLVVYVPGGGFVVAPRRMARRQRALVAAAGYAVASVEYRTTRQGATYTDGMADIQSALTYLIDRADEFAIDPGRIGIWGESAGGYLASMVGLTDQRIRAVVDQFGASDLSHVADGFDPRMKAAFGDPGHPVHRYRAIDADPADLAHPAAPAFLLMHGDDDRIIAPAQTELLHRALIAAGVDSTHTLLTGAGHGQLSLTRRQTRLWASVQVLTIIKDFFDQHLAR
ncbi:MAG TPA: alpha/beta hydrolase [Micromonosporaceae bacterium]|jgi:acetyl esterase/lipase